MYSYHYIRDQFVHESSASIPVQDIGITRGYGIFDYFQILDGVPLFIDDHLARFIHSCEKMRLNTGHPIEEIKSLIHQLMKINNIDQAGVKLVVTGGVSSNGFAIEEPVLSILALPYAMVSKEMMDKGTNLASHFHVRSLPEIKTTNYSMAIYLSPKVQSYQAIEPLYFTEKSVSECARSNIFGVRKQSLITPANHILFGITRKNVIRLAKESGHVVEERDVTMDELLTMDEVFLTGTTKQVLPIVKIDNHIIGEGTPGPVTQKIQKAYNGMVRDLIQQTEKDPILG